MSTGEVFSLTRPVARKRVDYAQPKSAHRFGQVPLPIIADSRLTEIDKTVYSALAAHRNAKHGKAWPKRQTIAKIVGCHPDSVSRSTTKLVECGYLTKTDGRGRGCTTFYRFPLEDQRQAQRREAQTQAAQSKPEPKPRAPRKPRPEREAENQKPDRTDSFCAATPYRGTERLTPKEFTPLPPSLPEAQVEPEASCAAAPRGEFLATHPTDLESLTVEIAAQATEQPATVPELPTPSSDKAPVQPHTAPYSPERSSTATPTTPKARLSLPSGLKGKPLGIITRMLCGLPFDDAQMLLDELAGNMRRHEVKNPIGYMRRLLELYRAGKLIPELADLEQYRRQRLAETERSKQIAEQRHLAALAQGQLPTPPPIPTTEPSAEEKARVAEHIRQAKLAARGALLSPEQRDAARAAYLESIGLGPKPAAPAAPAAARGEGYARFREEFERLKAGSSPVPT